MLLAIILWTVALKLVYCPNGYRVTLSGTISGTSWVWLLSPSNCSHFLETGIVKEKWPARLWTGNLVTRWAMSCFWPELSWHVDHAGLIWPMLVLPICPVHSQWAPEPWKCVGLSRLTQGFESLSNPTLLSLHLSQYKAFQFLMHQAYPVVQSCFL